MEDIDAEASKEHILHGGTWQLRPSSGTARLSEVSAAHPYPRSCRRETVSSLRMPVCAGTLVHGIHGSDPIMR